MTPAAPTARSARPIFAAAFLILFGVPPLHAGENSWDDEGGALAGSSGVPQLSGHGFLVAKATVGVDLVGAAAAQPAFAVVGLTRIDAPFLGGTLVPSPDVVSQPILTDANGEIHIATTWPTGIAPGIDHFVQFWIADPGGPQGFSASNAVRARSSDTPVLGDFPSHWNDGTGCPNEPAIQVHAYNEDLYILRQSLCTTSFAPFMYLLFGSERALMIDTGVAGVPIANTVAQIRDDWLQAHGKQKIEIVIAHSHAHFDHVGGDFQLNALPDTTLVGKSQFAVKNFFGITNWPDDIVPFDLGGGRIVDVIPIPGHEDAHLAFYDRQTANLFTGDSLDPGPLFVFNAVSGGNWVKYQASIQRLVDFTEDKDLCWVLGGHIFMTDTPGVQFPTDATKHPNEHVLQLTREHLIELHDAVKVMTTPMKEVHDDFIICPSG